MGDNPYNRTSARDTDPASFNEGGEVLMCGSTDWGMVRLGGQRSENEREGDDEIFSRILQRHVT